MVYQKNRQMAASENNIGLPSDAALDAMLAQMVRDIALGLPSDELSKRTLKIAKTAYKKALKDMINAWDYGDDICPPFWLGPRIAPWSSIVSGDPQPQPWRIGLADLNPQPLPPRSKTTIKVQTAEFLAQAATLTTDEIFSKALIDVAIDLYRDSVGENYSDDFVEWCGTVGSRRPIVVPPPPPPINVLGDLPIG